MPIVKLIIIYKLSVVKSSLNLNNMHFHALKCDVTSGSSSLLHHAPLLQLAPQYFPLYNVMPPSSFKCLCQLNPANWTFTYVIFCAPIFGP